MNLAHEERRVNMVMAVVLLLILFGLCVTSWGIVCGIVKIICALFGLTFSWEFATFVWFVALFVRWVLSEETSIDHRSDYG